MSSSLLAIATLAGGIALLGWGGNLLITSASSLARRLGVPALLIGLTILAWGTSAPEVALNLSATLRGQFPLVVGNVLGATICNLTLILGIGALLRPLAVHTQVLRRELPLMVLLTGLTAALGLWLHPEGFGPSYQRGEGVLLVLAFCGIGGWTIASAFSRRSAQAALTQDVQEVAERHGDRALGRDVVLLVFGVALLGLGGNLSATGAAAIARLLGLGEAVIGLTIVSLGTTLPELFTCIIGIRRNQADLVVGNAIGSCVFNLGAILGLCVVLHPAPLPPGSALALGVMCGVALLLIPISRSFHGTISRSEGALLVALYVIYLVVTVGLAVGA